VRGYVTSSDGFGLAAAQVLDLFDSALDQVRQLLAIEQFLAAAGHARDLILYYIGHGGFENRDYYLGIRGTQDRREDITAIESRKLAKIVREGFRRRRVYVIMDACFAASAIGDWQGDEAMAAVRNMEQHLPVHGTAFLAAASKHDVTLAPRAERYTIFTGAFLEALRHGIDNGTAGLSMHELYDEIRALLRMREADDEGRPELHVPSQREGDVSRLPLFPNVAHARALQARRAQEAARHEAARQEAARRDAARNELNRAQPAQQNAAREDAARQEALQSAAGSVNITDPQTADLSAAAEQGQARALVADPAIARGLPAALGVALPARLPWLFGAIGAALIAAIATIVVQDEADHETAKALAADVERLAYTFDAAARSAHMRADGIATTPMLRQAIETDAAVMSDLANTEMVFTADQGEALEVFQFRGERATSLLRIPKTALSVQPLKGRVTRFQSDGKGVALAASAPISAYRSGVAGGLVISMPVDLTAIRRSFGGHADYASLTGLGPDILLAGTADNRSASLVKFSVPSSGDWQAGNAAVVAIPKSAAHQSRVVYVRNIAGALGVLLITGFIVSIARHRRILRSIVIEGWKMAA
jgi:hypothetical protein